MSQSLLDKYLKNLKFVVLIDRKTGNPFELFFGFNLPAMHSEIFAEARRHYSALGREIGILGGGRITKVENYIVLHGRSEKYGRFENEVALNLAQQHPLLSEQGFFFLSQSGEDNAGAIVKKFEENQ